MLGDEPRLKAREEDGGRRTAEEAAHAQHPIELKVLGRARERGRATVGDQDHSLATELIGPLPDERAEDAARSKAHHKEDVDVGAAVAERRVERVDVRPLEPVGADRERVHGKIDALERGADEAVLQRGYARVPRLEGEQ